MKNKGMGAHKAVILAGGKGTRLYPITKQIPKPLLPIGKRPILNHLVDLFRAHGVTDIAVLVNKEFHEYFVVRRRGTPGDVWRACSRGRMARGLAFLPHERGRVKGAQLGGYGPFSRGERGIWNHSACPGSKPKRVWRRCA